MGAAICRSPTSELARTGPKNIALTAAYFGIFVSDDCKHAEERQRIIELYDHLRPSLHTYLCSLGLSQDHSEDVIQETFLRLVRHTADHGNDENVRAWVFRVAYNLSMDFHRFEKRWDRGNNTEPERILRNCVDPSPNPEQKIILDEQMKKFEDAFARLTPKQRHCVLLRVEGLRYREIALVLGVSVQRVGELIQRAITLLEVGA